MPEIFPDNKRWERTGRRSEQHRVDLSEEELANAARCEGIKQEHPCKNLVFVCEDCGNYGCAQETADKCTEQGFKNDKCLHCGKVGTRSLVMKEEFAAVREKWDDSANPLHTETEP